MLLDVLGRDVRESHTPCPRAYVQMSRDFIRNALPSFSHVGDQALISTALAAYLTCYLRVARMGFCNGSSQASGSVKTKDRRANKCIPHLPGIEPIATGAHMRLLHPSVWFREVFMSPG